MNYLDIVEEIKEDYREITTMIAKSRKKIRREILRRTVYPFSFPTVNLKTRNSNKWVMTIKIGSRSKLHEQEFCCYCIMESDRGHYIIRPAISLGESCTYIHMFSPHVFARYRERLNIDLNGLELVEHFFDKNSNYIADRKPCKDGSFNSEDVYSSISEGICLGETLDGSENIFFRTFITYDMLKGQQIDEFNATNEMRKELEDDFHPTKAEIRSYSIHV